MSRLVMLDLFSGLAGASAAMKDRGWKVYSVDIDERLRPTIIADVRHLPLRPFCVDLLWASPPCEEYSAKWQFGAWHKDALYPDLTLWQASLALIETWGPRFWVIENVRAAQVVWGRASFHFGSRYLWTNLPFLGQPDKRPIKMGRRDRRRDRPYVGYAQASKIEYVISEIVAAAVESLVLTVAA